MKFQISSNSCFESNKIKKQGTTSQMNWKKALNMMLQHLDSTKYYRVKSGLFGSRILTLRKDYNKKKEMDKTKAINYHYKTPI
jgi:hypothetical protein